MKLLRKMRFFWEDVWQTICNHKWLSIFCALVAIAGTVVGGVLVKVFEYSWWYNNRYEFATKLFNAGFGLCFTFFLWSAVFYFCLLVCNMHPKARFLSLLTLFLSCFYCGANTAAAIIVWSVWGILFAVLVTAIEVAGYFLAVLASCCVVPSRRTLKEAYCDTKPVFSILLVAFILKIVTFFVILRVLTAVI